MSSLSSPSKKAFFLVEFKYGDPEDPDVRLYVDSQVPLSGAFPVRMSIDIPEITGALKEKPLKIVMPADDFLSSLSSGLPFEPVYVTVYERLLNVSQTNVGGSDDVVWEGRVTRTVQNYRQTGSVQVVCKNWKSCIDYPINRGAMVPECILPFLKGDCGTFLSDTPFKATGTIDSVEGKAVFCDNASVVNKTVWNRGTITVNQISLRIRLWEASNPSRFLLVREPPTNWVGATASFLGGCNKTYAQCQEYGNEESFLAPGFSTPDYLPLVETGKSG